MPTLDFQIKCQLRVLLNEKINRNSVNWLTGEQLTAEIHFYPRAVLENNSGYQNMIRYEPRLVCQSNGGGSALKPLSTESKKHESSYILI